MPEVARAAASPRVCTSLKSAWGAGNGDARSQHSDATLALDAGGALVEPVVACLACQYAGWRLSDGKGKDAFFALGSGPARALARVEPLFEELGYRDKAPTATLVLESSPSTAIRPGCQGRR